jgi:endonuclease/exonuclease/phosphatase family metal-dependent hydrolase
MKSRLFVLLTLILLIQLSAQESFRIVSYNALKFPENSGTKRVSYFKTVIDELDPDILVLQEITSASGVDIFLNDILNVDEAYLYTAAPFADGYDTDNVLFFKSRSFSLASSRQIKTSLRDISEYELKVRIKNNMPNIWLYSTHLKAGSDADESARRGDDATIWRAQLNKLSAGTNFFVMGDLNFYSHTEAGFKVLTHDDGTTGQCFDPANKVGEWHNNRTYAKYHTQSTRTTSLYEGSTGGMDDRFDFILVSEALLDEREYFAPAKNYMAFGNDGFHFNSNINDGTNAVVSKTVANALYHASDHLPVVLDVVWNSTNTVDEIDETVQSFHFSNYPNPFNSTTKINFIVPVSGAVKIDVYDMSGRLVKRVLNAHVSSGSHSVDWNAGNLQSGVYLCQMQFGDRVEFKKMTMVK